ncbi:DUF1559 domain-containing protein [Geminisphaera colitermitum]|uniref:DUF1559 family PulG-like putative transporter n=1 Tax=Geminisphaera colitermitum TaxID=1148786 RepID=UPI000158C8B9|nr:DUF1559 domain-containing protein [Geminisphaera colitermitum]
MKKTSAFTLIELLTVIAIIGILAGIMIPVVGKVRGTARGAQCKSNLRQLATAISMYADEHKGLYPTAYPPPPGATDGNINWFCGDNNKKNCPIAPYISGGETADGKVGRATMRLVVCPSNEVGQPYPSHWIFPNGNAYGYPYAVNMSVISDTSTQVAANSITVPSQTVLMTDNSTPVTGGGTWTYGFKFTASGFDDPYWGTRIVERMGALHGEKTNIAWCDGHVTTTSVENFKQTYKVPQ